MSGIIHFVEKNIRGAWVVFGVDGIKQYYGYTKAEAIRRYKEDCKIVFEVREKLPGCLQVKRFRQPLPLVTASGNTTGRGRATGMVT